MQKIHWTTVKEENVRNSLWAEKAEEDEVLDIAEIKELESLFGTKSRGFQNKVSNATTMKVKKNVNLICGKRANNIAISLAQFRAFKSYDDLCKSVVIYDDQYLNSEKLQNMQMLLPTMAELKSIRAYKGGTEGLGRAEAFFLAVSKIPRFSHKLHAFEFSLQFREETSNFMEILETLHRACDEVVKSQKLAGMLRRLLAVGNLMNESTGRPKAIGITIDSLLKTAKKKGSDGKTSVLDHIVNTILKQGDKDNILQFWSDMQGVKDSMRVDINDCKNCFMEIKGNISKIQATIQCEKNYVNAKNIEIKTSQLFIKKSEIFIEKAGEVVKSIEYKLSCVEEAVHSLCNYFAEDPKAIQTSSIFSVLVDFSNLVSESKEKWRRMNRAEKRKQSMMKTGS